MRYKQPLMILLLALAWTAGPLAHARTESVAVIEVQHRPAGELVDAIEPLVGPEGGVRAIDHRLVVRASAARLRSIRKVVAKLDVSPRQLVIHVRQGVAAQGNRLSGGVTGRLGHDSSVRAGVSAGGARRRHTADQSVRVLDNHPAVIRVGSEVPVVERRVVVGAPGSAVVTRQTFQPVMTGFRLTPHVHGAQFTLAIAPQMQQLDTDTLVIRDHRLRTTVSGKLGQWVDIGQALQAATRSFNGLVHAGGASATGAYHVAIKVVAAD